MPTLSLKRRLAALERQLPEPAPTSKLSKLFAYMNDADLELLNEIINRMDAHGNVPAEDLGNFERICLAALEQRNKSEPTRA